MKKNIMLFSIGIVSMSNLYSQELYFEDFEDFNLGIINENTDGFTPGQGDWYVRSSMYNSPPSETWFQIVNDIQNQKSFQLTSTTFSNTITVQTQKREIDALIDSRDATNHVIKFEFDFNPGPQASTSSILPNFSVYSIFLNQNDNFLDRKVIAGFDYFPESGIIKGTRNSHQPIYYRYNLGRNDTDLYIPFNTWTKFIIHIDYQNNTLYYEIPSLNVLKIVTNFSPDSFPNNMLDFTPKSIEMSSTMHVDNSYARFDNIKITATQQVTLNNEKNEKVNYSIYPNPTTDYINIVSNETHLIQNIQLFDLTGKCIKTYENNFEKIDVNEIQKGLYVLKINSLNGFQYKKIEKK